MLSDLLRVLVGDVSGCLLHALEYSLQAPRKTREGASHPDRHAPFAPINQQVRACHRRGHPVIAVAAKKKALVGDFTNGGREWPPQGSPEPVRTHDCEDKTRGKGIPSGVDDPTHHAGWVSVGLDHDTASFATDTIRRWWQEMGRPVDPKAATPLGTADAGGSHSSRSRVWNVAVQEVADHIRLRISVCHWPPGTSTWHKIAHRMGCHITNNWRGRPFISRSVIVNLLGNTTTTTGLYLNAALDTNCYDSGLQGTDAQLAARRIKRHMFHGAWHYTISPRP
jgi:hypothetical protein